jgi:hypothetical protein
MRKTRNRSGDESRYSVRLIMNRSLDKERYIADNEVELQMRKVKMQMIKGIRLIMTRNADEDRFKAGIGTQIRKIYSVCQLKRR